MTRLFLTFISLFAAIVANAQTDSLRFPEDPSLSVKFKNAYITIKKADFSICTFFAISCDLFDIQFRGAIKEKSISNLKDLQSLANFEIADTIQSIDVRASITINYGEYQEEYCMDKFGTFINKNTGVYYQNKPLFNFITGLVFDRTSDTSKKPPIKLIP